MRSDAQMNTQERAHRRLRKNRKLQPSSICLSNLHSIFFFSFFSQFAGAFLLFEIHRIDKQICRFCSGFTGSGILIGESQLETLLLSDSKISFTTHAMLPCLFKVAHLLANG
jgi:hypothetical protein